MINYLIPFFILVILTHFENIKKFNIFINKKSFYLCLCVFLTLFVGLRNEVGCDWESYNYFFDLVSSYNLSQIIDNYQNLPDFTFILIAKLVSLNFNYYILNLVFAILFTFPLFLFSYRIKRKYFALMISYPYYILVLGMANLRQAVCLSFLLLSIYYVSKKKNKFYFFSIIFSFLTHHSSILANSLVFAGVEYKKNKYNSFIKLLFIFTLSLILIYNFPIILNKLRAYFDLNLLIVSPAKSAIWIWIINFLPAIIFFIKKTKFKFSNNLKRIFLAFLIYDIAIIPLLLINSVIAYRLILYSFPMSIFIIATLPDMNIFSLKGEEIVNILIILSFLSLIVWLYFANHAYCYLPYKNILLHKL